MMLKGAQTDIFRPLTQIFEPDERQTCYSVIEDGGARLKTIEDHDRVIERFSLHSSVPPDVAEHFETAKELLVHAWCNLRFTQIAERHAYATVEMALRQRLASEWAAHVALTRKAGKKINARPTFAPLLRLAVDLDLSPSCYLPHEISGD